MNTDALEHWFDTHGIEYHWQDTGVYLLSATTLSSSTLGEIAACGGSIRVDSGRVFVEDDSDE